VFALHDFRPLGFEYYFVPLDAPSTGNLSTALQFFTMSNNLFESAFAAQERADA
jgi:hypothetical protein